MKYVASFSRFLILFPIMVIAFLYGTWGAGRLALGYWPRPSLDDPKQIHGGLMWMYDVTAFLIYIGIPLFASAILMLAMVVLVTRPPDWRARFLELGLAIVTFLGFMGFSYWDPQSVVMCFFD